MVSLEIWGFAGSGGFVKISGVTAGEMLDAGVDAGVIIAAVCFSTGSGSGVSVVAFFGSEFCGVGGNSAVKSFSVAVIP